MDEEELQKKREEAERKARRGELDPAHEFTFSICGQVIVYIAVQGKEHFVHPDSWEVFEFCRLKCMRKTERTKLKVL